jgi:hypothetical protein
MPDSCNAAINEGYKNHTVIKIKHKDTKREFHLKSSTKGRLQRKVSYKEPITKESFLQRADYEGKFSTKSRLQKLSTELQQTCFRKERLIQKFTAGDIVQWNMINKGHHPQEKYSTGPAKADLRRKAVPDPPSRQ